MGDLWDSTLGTELLAHFPVLAILEALEPIKQVDLLAESGVEPTPLASDNIAAAPIPLERHVRHRWNAIGAPLHARS